MPAAEDDHFRDRNDGFDKDLDFPAADESALGHRLLGQIECHDARLLVTQDVLSRGPNVGFDAAAADGTERGAIIAHQHFGGVKARHRSADLDNRSQDGFASFPAQALDLIENIGVHRASSLTYPLTLLGWVSRIHRFSDYNDNFDPGAQNTLGAA